MKLVNLLALLVVIIGIQSCVDLDFAEPPVDGVDLPENGNTSIADLKALADPNKLVEISEDLKIEGIVVADDRSGNFFREFILQDETGGIEVLVNLTSLYNSYPIGREVVIKCQGLFLGFNSGVIQLGGYTYVESGGENLGDIIDFNERILKGRVVGAPEPKVTTINELGTDDISTLIKLENVEFIADDLGQTLADPVGRQSINRFLTTCDGQEIIVRSSGFADFAGEIVPGGNGSITAIFSVFRDDRQLFIREFEDFSFGSDRCTEGSATGNEQQINIADLREVFEGVETSAPSNRKIKGTVISDRATSNITGQNLVIQDETGGIVVRFEDDHNFDLNEEIEVIVSGQELSEFNGLLQVNNVANSLATLIGQGASPEPRSATVQEILDNQDAWESTLVLIENATITGSSTLSGGTTVTDATASIDMFTRSGASFAGQSVPSGAVNLTAIVSEFNGPQVNLRNLEDIDGEIDPGGGSETIIDIKDIRDLFTAGTTSAPAERKIRGIVISDKDNGNFDGQNMVIQDQTAGIIVRFGGDHDFSLGQEVEVVVSNQELSEFRGLLQINNVPNGSATLIGTGTLPNPRTATVQEVLDNYNDWESTLVLIEGATISGDNGVFAGSTTVADASGNVPMFTMNDATFANESLPADPVNLVSIVSDFDGAQIIMRNISDLEGSNNTGGDLTQIDIIELRNSFNGGASTAPTNRKIKGIVISDFENANTTGRNVVIQDGTGGIVVRFLEDHTLALGREVEIEVSNQELSEFRSLLQVNNVPNSSITDLGEGTLPDPRQTTIQELISNLDAWESTLVKINDVTITGNATYNGVTMVTDATGNISMFTRSAATFSGQSVPTGNVNITAVVTEFDDTPQISIRSTDDIN